MEPENASKTICAKVSYADHLGFDIIDEITHHPCIASPSVDEPSSNLARGLDNEQRAEALEQLEYRTRVPQHIVPRAKKDGLEQALLAKHPLSPARALGLEDAAERPLHPARAAGIGVDAKLAQRPDEQRRDDEPLRQPQQRHDGPADARRLGRGQADGRVEDVEDGQAQAVGQPAISAADIEGDGDGQDDGEEEDAAEEDAEWPPHRGGCGRQGRAVPRVSF